MHVEWADGARVCCSNAHAALLHIPWSTALAIPYKRRMQATRQACLGTRGVISAMLLPCREGAGERAAEAACEAAWEGPSSSAALRMASSKRGEVCSPVAGPETCQGLAAAYGHVRAGRELQPARTNRARVKVSTAVLQQRPAHDVCGCILQAVGISHGLFMKRTGGARMRLVAAVLQQRAAQEVWGVRAQCVGVKDGHSRRAPAGRVCDSSPLSSSSAPRRKSACVGRRTGSLIPVPAKPCAASPSLLGPCVMRRLKGDAAAPPALATSASIALHEGYSCQPIGPQLLCF